MNRCMLNMAFSRASKDSTGMAIAAHILDQQDQEPWKRKFDSWSDALNAKRAQREVDRLWIEQHPWRAFVYLTVRKMFK